MLKKMPFPNPKGHAAFIRSFINELSDRLKAGQAQFISAANVQTFNHGMNWQSHNSSTPDDISTMQNIRNEISIKKSDLANYNTETIEHTIKELSDLMLNSFLREMYATVSRSCEASGQVVDGKGKSIGENFIEVLEKLEFGVDRQGVPVFPEIHVGPEAYEKFKNDASMHAPEIKIQVDKISERKQQEALTRESERLAKFKARND